MAGRSSLFLRLGSVPLLMPCLEAASISLAPLKDNVIYEDESGNLSNALGPNLHAGENGGGGGNLELRSLITFDISAIPAGSTVNQVSLRLIGNSNRGTSITVDTSLHRILANWGEGSSVPSNGGGGSGGTSTEGDATWIHRFSTTPLWETPGGDFSAQASASLEVTENNLYTYSSLGLVSDVQGFVDGTFDNFGWILIAEDGGRAKRFGSGDHPDEIFRPELVVDYRPVPEPEVSLLLFGALTLTLFRCRRT